MQITLYRTSPDISLLREKPQNAHNNFAEQVSMAKSICHLQENNIIEVESGQVILIVGSEISPPHYIGEKHGRWGWHYFKSDVLGVTVLLKDKEYWLPEYSLRFLKECDISLT